MNGVKMDEHRKMMEDHLGRKLTSCEIVHHIDGDTKNNDIENLQVMSVEEHLCHHNFGVMSSMERQRRGRMNPSSAILCKADIPIIRELLANGKTCAVIAAEYGVGRTAIQKIKTGQRWAHVTCRGL